MARPQIQTRMLQYEENQFSFNLLALCQSPIPANRKSVLHAVVAVHYLDGEMETKYGDAYSKLVSESDTQLDTGDDTLLAEYDLKPEDVTTAVIPDSLKEQVGKETLNASDAASLRCQLVIEARATMGEYRDESRSAIVDEERVTGRKKDYGSMLHKWISKLAEKGSLEEIITLSS